MNFYRRCLLQQIPYENGRELKVYDILQKASTNVETEFRDQPKIEAAIQSTIGNTFTNLGDYDEAKEHLTKALDLKKELYGEFTDETASSYHDLRFILSLDRRFEKSRFTLQ